MFRFKMLNGSEIDALPSDVIYEILNFLKHINKKKKKTSRHLLIKRYMQIWRIFLVNYNDKI